MATTTQLGRQEAVRIESAKGNVTHGKEKQTKNINAILLGPPGSGKRTQADLLAKKNCVCHLATGDMLQLAAQSGTRTGERAKNSLNSEKVVNDELLLEIIDKSLDSPQCRNGFVLEGFPKTATQAEKFDDLLYKRRQRLDSVIELDVKEDLLLKRIAGRLLHKASGRIYHEEFSPPKESMKDDVTCETLIRRNVDNESSFRTRLLTYRNQISPVLDYYRRQNLLTTIDASKSPLIVFANIQAVFSTSRQRRITPRLFG